MKIKDYIMLAILILIVAIILWFIFGRKDYEFTEEEKKELDLIDHLKDINDSEHLLGKISHKEYKETNGMLIKMVDEVERKNRHGLHR